jgi:hypothetical protein
MKAFLTSYAYVILVLLIICFVHFIDALTGKDWHLFLYGALTLLLLIVFIILVIGGNA